jgi:Protein of unknown function (DUF2786)
MTAARSTKKFCVPAAGLQRTASARHHEPDMSSAKLSCGDKLAKLLALAASGNEAEAIAALRAAGRLLKAHGLDWNDVASRFTGSKQPAKSLKQAFDDVFVDWDAPDEDSVYGCASRT